MLDSMTMIFEFNIVSHTESFDDKAASAMHGPRHIFQWRMINIVAEFTER